jgi:hypothetical protein
MESPTQPVPIEGNEFSALSATTHIDAMASQIHFMGTKENRIVRDYILNKFEKLGIETEIFTGFSENKWGSSYTRIAKTENIIATIKGQSSDKCVLIAGHYDSVLSSPGAADDVHAVACMLEVAKLLKQEKHLHDIVFLITDGEEMGLFGAKAFVETKDLSNIGVVLNYEARGNSGPNISFEWSEGNAWLVHQLRKAGKRPIASSLSFEIYKRLPNDTDFTHFKNAGLTGINNAFIDGFPYYHNPDDRPENINLSSVQHTGENMRRMAKHFANTDLSNTRTYNASFFNFLSFLVIYPSKYDLALLILVCLFSLVAIYYNIRKLKLSLKSMLVGLLCLLGGIIFSAGLATLLGMLTLKIYTHYNVFYSGQYYNHKWYLLATIGLTLIVLYYFVSLFIKKFDVNALKANALIILTSLSVALYFMMPTASYFMMIPTLALGIKYYLDAKYSGENKIINTSSLILSVFPLAIWAPLVLNLFLAFSLKLLAGPAMITCLLLMAVLICFQDIWIDNKLKNLGLILLMLGMLGGHFSSKPSEKYPLPSSLFYVHNVDTQKSYWATNDDKANIGNKDFLENAKFEKMYVPNPVELLTNQTETNSHIKIPIIKNDSSLLTRKTIFNFDEVFISRIYCEDASNIQSLKFNGYEAISTSDMKGAKLFDLFGMSQDSLEIDLIKKDSSKIQLLGISSKMFSIPSDKTIPENVRLTDNYTAIIQTVKF